MPKRKRRIATFRGLRVRLPRRRYASLRKVPLPPPLRLAVDPVKILLEDRRKDR